MSITSCVLIIGGGILQAKTFEECRALGLSTVLVDGNENCYCSKLADYFIKASTQDPGEIICEVVSFLNANGNILLKGVYTQGTDVEHSVAYCAEKLKLHGIGIESAQLCHNKIMTRNKLSGCGIPQPKYFILEKPYSFVLPSGFKFPLVFKSIDNSASRGLSIVHNNDEVATAIDCALEYSKDKRVLVEEFLDGNEYSVDTVLYRGQLFKCGISDRQFIKKRDYAIQYGSLTPSLLKDSTQEKMYEVMDKVAKCFGISDGAFKGDLIINKGQIKVLEVTARLSGGFDSQYRKPLSFGMNLIKPTIQIACGVEPDIECLKPKYKRFSKTISIFPKPGIVNEIIGIDEIKKIEGVVEVFCLVKVGDFVQDYKHCANRTNYVILVANTMRDLNKLENKIKSIFKIVTK